MSKEVGSSVGTVTQSSLNKFIKYIITGLLAFSIEYSLYLILYTKLHLHYIIASVIVYSIVFWFSFLGNRYWAFQSKGDIKNQLFLYALLFMFNLIVSNIFVMYLLTSIMGISPFITPFIKAGLVVCWNFIFYKKYIYK